MAHVEIDCADILRALRAGQAALERETGNAVDELAKRIADNARKNHTYTDRTTNLTNSIDVLPGPGLREAQVFAGEFYASHVEERLGFAFMQPAADQEDDNARVEGIFVNACLRVEGAMNSGGRR
jgi:hypothetical protein